MQQTVDELPSIALVRISVVVIIRPALHPVSDVSEQVALVHPPIAVPVAGASPRAELRVARAACKKYAGQLRTVVRSCRVTLTSGNAARTHHLTAPHTARRSAAPHSAPSQAVPLICNQARRVLQAARKSRGVVHAVLLRAGRTHTPESPRHSGTIRGRHHHAGRISQTARTRAGNASSVGTRGEVAAILAALRCAVRQRLQ